MSRPIRTIPTTSQPINPTEMIFSKLIWYSLSVLRNVTVWAFCCWSKQGSCRHPVYA
jgi:hypothetical protein